MKEKTILLGKVDEIVYTLTFKDGNVSHTGYKDIFDYDQGKQRAKDYLENDTELWKLAVENDDTIKGLDEYNEEIIDIDGWESVLGEGVHEIDYSGYYFDDYNLIEDDGIPYDEYDFYDDILIEKEDFYHICNILDQVGDIKNLETIFDKYPEFNAREDLKYYVN